MVSLNFPSRVNEAEIKLKNYVDIVANWENDFEEFVKTDMVSRIINEVMCRQDYRRFVAKCQQTGEGSYQYDETIYLMLNSAMSSIGLLNCIDHVSKGKELESYIPKLIELISWVCEVERCTLYLYDSEKGWLYIKATSGRMRENIEISTDKDDYVMRAFIHGQKIMKNKFSESKKAERMWLDSKIGTFTQNLLCMPINYADFSIGVIELTNKPKKCEFTDLDTKLVEKVCKHLASGLLQEEMETNLKNEQKKQKQMEQKLNSNNLKAYVPLFTNLSTAIEQWLGFRKALIYLYDKEIDLLFSIPQVGNDGELDYKGIVKMHSKRGFVGKVFSNCEIWIANGKKEVEEQLEAEETNMSKFDSNLKDITQIIGVPIESKLDDKVVGILQLSMLLV